MKEQKEIQKQFLDLYEPVHVKFLRYCKVITKNNEMAKELHGDVILAAYEGFSTLRNPASFKFFLFAIARNLFKKKLRRKKYWTTLDSDKSEQIQDDSQSAEVNIDVALLYEMMDRLPIEQKEALTLFEIAGFSLKEIQDIQGGSISTIKMRLSRGRQKLKELMID